MTDDINAIKLMARLTKKLIYEPNPGVDPYFWELKKCGLNEIILRNIGKLGNFVDSTEAAYFLFGQRIVNCESEGT